MNPVTLRNVPSAVARSIRRRAAEKRISLNRAVLELLEEALGAKPGPGREIVHTELDELFGAWSAEEAAAFQKQLGRQRGIDRELWS